jgi:hypothetical protein
MMNRRLEKRTQEEIVVRLCRPRKVPVRTDGGSLSTTSRICITISRGVPGQARRMSPSSTKTGPRASRTGLRGGVWRRQGQLFSPIYSTALEVVAIDVPIGLLDNRRPRLRSRSEGASSETRNVSIALAVFPTRLLNALASLGVMSPRPLHRGLSPPMPPWRPIRRRTEKAIAAFAPLAERPDALAAERQDPAAGIPTDADGYC